MSNDAKAAATVTRLNSFNDLWRTINNDPELRGIYIRTRLEMRRQARHRSIQPARPSAWWRPMIDEVLSHLPDARPVEMADVVQTWLGPLDLNADNAPTVNQALIVMQERHRLEKAVRNRLQAIGIR